MILRVAPGGIVLLIALAGSVCGQDDDSLASTFLTGKNSPHDVIICGNVTWNGISCRSSYLALNLAITRSCFLTVSDSDDSSGLSYFDEDHSIQLHTHTHTHIRSVS